jgi:Protein of unknown function (DUF3606)
LLVVLAVCLAWAAFSRKAKPRKLYGAQPDAFDFPTTDSRAGIDLDDRKSVTERCAELGCSEEQLRAAVRASRRSAAAVRQRLAHPDNGAPRLAPASRHRRLSDGRPLSADSGADQAITEQNCRARNARRVDASSRLQSVHVGA